MRVGATVYSDRSSAEAASLEQFTSEAASDYYNTFDIECFYVLERII